MSALFKEVETKREITIDKPESEAGSPESEVWVPNMSPKSQIQIFGLRLSQ